MTLRGFQLPTFNVDIGSLKLILAELSKLGCTLARWQMVNPDLAYPIQKEINTNGIFRSVKQHYYDWYFWELQRIKEASLFIERNKLNIKLVIDCHTPIGGVRSRRVGRDEHRIINNKKTSRYFKQLWLETVKQLGNLPAVHAWGICNEPASPQPQDWIRLARSTAKLIRNQEKNLGLEPKVISLAIPRGGVKNIKHMKAWPKLNPLWIEVHVYHPADITFFGVNRDSEDEVKQAGFEMLSGSVLRYWEPVDKWRNLTGGQVYVGEIGCSIHAPKHYQYEFWTRWLSLLHSKEIPYTIHAFREHHAFSYEGHPVFNYIMERINE